MALSTPVLNQHYHFGKIVGFCVGLMNLPRASVRLRSTLAPACLRFPRGLSAKPLILDHPISFSRAMSCPVTTHPSLTIVSTQGMATDSPVVTIVA